MSENSAAKLTTLDETQNCVKMKEKETEEIFPGISYSETPFPITRWKYPSTSISFARYEPEVHADVKIENKNYKETENQENGLSVYQLNDTNDTCFIKEENNNNQKKRIAISNLKRYFSNTSNQIFEDGKSKGWRFFCYCLPANCALPDGWELIFDNQQEDSLKNKFWHGVLRRKTSCDSLDIHELKTPFKEKFCDLDTGLENERCIAKLPWKEHCFQIRGNAYPKDIEDFEDPEMIQIYEYFVEWIEYEDEDKDLEEKEEILGWFTKNKFENLVSSSYDHQEISTRFQDWLQDHEDEEARKLLEKITVLV